MRHLWSIAMLLLVTACAAVSPSQRREAAERIALEAGWQRAVLEAGTFSLVTFVPPALQEADTLTVYIEGDGMAWISRSQPSFDPTPRDPVALQLALRDQSGRAVYLARPCQYVADGDRHGCEQRYWTSHRFAPEVIEASNRAIDQLQQRYHARKLMLVGYSGGGAVAALVAAQRHAVVRLVTVAGNLDIATWAERKHITPLTGSLNPADAWRELAGIPQIHFVGDQDKVMAPAFAESYRAHFPAAQQPNIIVIPEFDHHCCWARDWPGLAGKAGL